MRGASAHTLASGVFAALLTPRKPDSTEADAASLLEYLDKVSKAGVDGLVFFGSTGEFIHFDLEERMRVVALAARRTRVPVLVNVSHSTLSGAVELAEQAAGAGAAGLLLMPPHFYHFDDDVLAEFYAQFVKAVGTALPIYLYNLPQSTAPMSPNLLRRLLCCGSFAGIKNSDANWASFETLLQIRQQHPFQLLVGNEHVYVKALAEGADGSVSGIAAALPELPVAIYRAVRSGDTPAAAVLSARLDELMSRLEALPPLTGLKQIAAVRSWLPFLSAIPLDEITLSKLHAFSEWLQGWLPATLHACASQPSVRT